MRCWTPARRCGVCGSVLDADPDRRAGVAPVQCGLHARGAGCAAAPGRLKRAQVPARRAAERDQAAIAAWRQDAWPVLKGRRRTRGMAVLRRRVRPGPEATAGTYLRPPRPHPGGAGDRRLQQAGVAGRADRRQARIRPRLIYRVHTARRRGSDSRKGFTETDHARFLDAARQQPRWSCVSTAAACKSSAVSTSVPAAGRSKHLSRQRRERLRAGPDQAPAVARDFPHIDTGAQPHDSAVRGWPH
jgi:hypothetical protein